MDSSFGFFLFLNRSTLSFRSQIFTKTVCARIMTALWESIHPLLFWFVNQLNEKEPADMKLNLWNKWDFCKTTKYYWYYKIKWSDIWYFKLYVARFKNTYLRSVRRAMKRIMCWIALLKIYRTIREKSVHFSSPLCHEASARSLTPQNHHLYFLFIRRFKKNWLNQENLWSSHSVNCYVTITK